MSSKSTLRSDSSSELEELVCVELLTLVTLEAEELMELLDELADVEEKFDVEGLREDTTLLTCGGMKSQLASVSVNKINSDPFVFI
jgi:hypothetical protein